MSLLNFECKVIEDVKKSYHDEDTKENYVQTNKQYKPIWVEHKLILVLISYSFYSFASGRKTKEEDIVEIYKSENSRNITSEPLEKRNKAN